jgi:DNA-binding winged helix-turn-helix (wHTH) protein/tetratricopeptide (TPR) repeat protein
MSEKNGHCYEFGDFRLETERPSLWRDEELVPLPPKALEVLLLLVRRRDIIVSREELLNTVWRDTFVEDGNINYTVSLLRKTLDKDDKGRFIQTVPKRGYRFVADVLEVSANGHAESAVQTVAVALETKQPKAKIPWHFIGIVLLGTLLVTGFVVWRRLDKVQKLPTTSDPSEKDSELLASRHTDNPEAFRAYIRGRAILDAKNPDNFEKAIDEFQKAVALDPTFALPYAGLADASTRRGFNTSGESAEEFYARSKALAQKALSLDPEVPEAYFALGTVKRIYDWDWAGAERDFRRAIELNPNYARAHLGYALLLSCLGRRDEALVEIKRAMEIDPLSQDIKSGYLTILEGRGEYAEALAQAQENVNFNKEYRRGMRGVATFLFHLGQYPRVIEISDQELTAKNSQEFAWLSLLVTSHHRSGQTGKREERLKQLEALAETDTKALYALAENYTELGRTDEALAALEKCIAVREERMMWVKVEPRLAQLKGHARFNEILRRMNLAAN